MLIKTALEVRTRAHIKSLYFAVAQVVHHSFIKLLASRTGCSFVRPIGSSHDLRSNTHNESLGYYRYYYLQYFIVVL